MSPKYEEGSELNWSVNRALTALEAAEDKASDAAVLARRTGQQASEGAILRARDGMRDARLRLQAAAGYETGVPDPEPGSREYRSVPRVSAQLSPGSEGGCDPPRKGHIVVHLIFEHDTEWVVEVPLPEALEPYEWTRLRARRAYWTTPAPPEGRK